ncbi:MAG: tRNA-dihydrouridine synthase family protein [Spirochaetes bacterium]|nr:tRNA-dihydrouridine synthase family protein [Spirochaetota bacterium]
MINSEKKLFMAPMAEITTSSLRRCIRKFNSCTILYSEMLSAAAIVHGSEQNKYLLNMNRDDNPYVFQILGGGPDLMAAACEILTEKGAEGIDINMGCSAPDIIKKLQGSRLLSNMVLARDIVKRCRKVCKGRLSVKMRSGFEYSDRKYLVDFAKMLEGEGVDYIILHPRDGKQSFKRTADWNLVKLLKENLNIPVIGNGDIASPEDAVRRFNETGCNGIMIGREGVRAPWIFALSDELIRTGSYRLEVDLAAVFKEVLLGIKNDLPEYLHKSRAHRFAFYFSKNFVFSHEIFRKIRNLNEIDLMIEIIDEYVLRNPNEKIKIFTGG